MWAQEIGTQALHQRLSMVDPIAAERIDHRNVRRTIRALEVIFHTGKRFSDQRLKKGHSYSVLQLGLRRSRPELFQRIDRRIDEMFAGGFEDEVRRLIAEGYAPSLPSMSAIGYHEVIQYLQGKITQAEAIALIKRRTRQFVRRQANWFKENDPAILWFDANPGVLGAMSALIRNWLGYS
jgi:tRNA dimethylallyltransferase